MSNSGRRMEMMMMTPPMVGVPFFCIWPSSPRLRTSSPTCIRCSRRMILCPNARAISSEIAKVSPARKEMYPSRCFPGKSHPEPNCSYSQ